MGGEGEESCQLTLNAPEKKTTTTQRGEERAIWGGTAFSDHTVPLRQLLEETHLTITRDANVHIKRKYSDKAKQRADSLRGQKELEAFNLDQKTKKFEETLTFRQPDSDTMAVSIILRVNTGVFEDVSSPEV